MADTIDRAPGAPLEDCDLVMKGGVTSGVVYPYAILELAQRYRFRSIGGASAGAIAAAFAGAMEYARRSGDPDALARFKTRCDQIPSLLGGLFQASPPFERVMAAALAATGAKEGQVWRVLRALAAPLLAGAGAGLLAFGVLSFVPLALGWSPGAGVVAVFGAMLAAIFGALALLAVYLGKLLTTDLPAHDYGLCSGLGLGKGKPPALTDWIHESLQLIAFGPAGRATPLTFHDLATVGLSPAEIAEAVKAIELRMMTTNLSLGRPHAIPDFGLDLMFDPVEWRKLFPTDVMAYLTREDIGPADRAHTHLHRAPSDDRLPVVVGVRMSLSFPILIQAVPMHMLDVGASVRKEVPEGEPSPLRRILFSDGGITSNFPIHFFDALLPARPTFALSLDDMHAPGLPRISLPQAANDGAFSPIRPFAGVMGFVGAILGAAKDWQDEMLSVMPGQRQRVVRIRLDKDEGGLNLNMPEARSRRLMGYGADAGRQIRTTFDFEEHRYRRTLVAYQHFAKLSAALARTWPTYGAWYRAYAPRTTSYKTMVKGPDRLLIADHLDAFAQSHGAFQPPLSVSVRFPKPTGRLSIVPDV